MIRGILVIHGIGEQKKGDFLRDVVGPLARYLESKGGKVDFEPEIALGFDAKTPVPAQVTMMVRGPGGFVEEWHVQEACWAAAFRPPTLPEMIRWGRALIAREAEAIGRIAENPLNEMPLGPWEARPLETWSDTQKYPDYVRKYYVWQASMYGAVAWLMHKTGRGLLTLVWLLLLLRGLPSPPAAVRRLGWVGKVTSWLTKAVNSLANALYPFVVQSLGDAKKLLDDPIAADAIRRPFEDAFIQMLWDKDIQSITVIAHSLGAAISYDAMTEERAIDLYLKAHPEKRFLAGSADPRHITWVTLGSALNRTYTMTEQAAAAHARSRFRSPIGSAIRTPETAFSWLNIYSRYDPVSAGGLEMGFWKCTQVKPEQTWERLVINNDSMLSDHSAYWKNDVLVWPRIVRAICDDKYPWPETNLSERENQRLIRDRTVGIADRGLRTLVIVSPLLLVAVLALALLAVPEVAVYLIIRGLWLVYRAVSWLAFKLLDGVLAVLHLVFKKKS